MTLALLLLALLPAGDPIDTADTDRQRLIGALMWENRWAEAADEAEIMLVRGHAPTFDFEISAGNLRNAAGHHAHAWRHFERFSRTPDLTPAVRAVLNDRLAEATRRTRLVVIHLTPAVAGTTLVARRLGDLRPPDLDSPVLDGEAAVRLDNGTWELRIDAPGHVPLRQIVGPDVAGPLALTLQTPIPAAPTAAAPTAAAPTAAAPTVAAKRRVPPEQIAGGIVLPLGIVALAGALAVLPAHHRVAARFDELRADPPVRPFSPADSAEFRDLTATSRRQEHLMIGLGATAGALVTAGVVLLVRGAHERRHHLHLDAKPGAFVLGLSGHF